MNPSPEIFFKVIEYLLENDKNFGSSLGGVMEFNLSGKIYGIDFQNRKVFEGPSGKADCTQIMERAEFLKMINKEADPTELFMTQKLKLDGDLGMAMEFGNVMESLTTEKIEEIISLLTLDKMNQGLNFNSDIVMERISILGQKKDFGLTGIFQFCFTKGDKKSVWTLNSNKKPISVSHEGKLKPDCIITLDDNDFLSLFQQKTNPMDLFMSQRLKIDGDMALGMQLQNLIDAIPDSERSKL